VDELVDVRALGARELQPLGERVEDLV